MLAWVKKYANAKEAYEFHRISIEVKVEEKKDEGEDRRASPWWEDHLRGCNNLELHLDTDDLGLHLEIDDLRALLKVGWTNRRQGGSPTTLY